VWACPSPGGPAGTRRSSWLSLILLGAAWATATTTAIANDTVTSAQEALPLPDTAEIYLVDQDDVELRIGSVQFFDPQDAEGSTSHAVSVELDAEDLTDHFLSMRPFRCLEDPKEWYCHLPYPYDIDARVTNDDLTDLSYQLLFIRKKAGEFGIDAWNGLYYVLERQSTGEILGYVSEGDLNVLAEPPKPGSRPIDLGEFITDGTEDRRFPALIIRP
jgi:hypothetical protein